MDATRFDALTRAIAAGTTRRTLSGLLATFLALLALAGPGLASDAAAKKKNQRRKQKKTKAEGPCGDGSGKANRCKRNRQCCTGYCQKRKKKRKNGKKRAVQGRCRCRKDGQACSDDANCCPERTGRICKDGACQSPLCAEICPDGCCDGESCLAGDSDEACGTGGAPCQTCQANQICSAGTCAPGTCAQTCSGCCTGETCKAGDGAAACGKDGETCQQCSGDTPQCFGGACVCGDICATGCRYSTIQEAIDESNDTIFRLCDEPYLGTITIDRGLTLIGAGEAEGGTTLNGNGAGPVVTVEAGVVVSLQDLRITGGVNDPDGGGIYNSGDLTLTRVTVIDNEAGDDGGGIFNDNGTVSISSSSVTDNTASGGGGGIFNSGGGTVTINASDITGNTCTIAGGGIINNGGMTITGNSIVSGNESLTGNGGGIMNNGRSLEISQSSVTLNKALDEANGLGGGIFNSLTLTITDVTITGNEARSGGGIYNAGSFTRIGTNDIFDNMPDQCAGSSCV